MKVEVHNHMEVDTMPHPIVSVGMAACVVLICQAAVVGVLFLLRVQRKWVSHIEVLIMSLGCWTMIADALMHILPEAILSLEAIVTTHHEIHRYNVLLGFSAILGATIMLTIEVLVHSVQHTGGGGCDGHHGHKHDAKHGHQGHTHHDHTHHDHTHHDHTHRAHTHHEDDLKLSERTSRDNLMFNPDSTPHTANSSDDEAEEARELVNVKSGHNNGNDAKHSAAAAGEAQLQKRSDDRHHDSVDGGHAHAHHQFRQFYDEEFEEDTAGAAVVDPLRIAAAWSNSAGAAVHNIVDGISIAVAFGGGMRVGVATLVCVVVHEVPVQLTGFLLFRKAGFSPLRSLLLNCIVASFIILGTFSVSFVHTSIVWQACLMAAVAGNFLAISFYMLLREVQDSVNAGPTARSRATLQVISAVGLCVGVGVIALLGLVE